MPEQDTIHMLNVASSSQQAQQAFFIPMTRAVDRKGSWFKDRCNPKPGVGIISWDKNVEMVSGHADAESQEGLNLILGLADEVDAFKTREEFMRLNHGREPLRSVESILKMLKGSASTRFPETFKNVRISYPRYLGSTIQNLIKEGNDDIAKRGDARSRHFVSGPLPTWVVNPRYKDYTMVEIPQTDIPVPDLDYFLDDYEKDPATAKGIYECKPARAVDTYFKNMDAVRSCFTDEANPVEVDYVTRTIHSDVTGEQVLSWEPSYTFAPSLVPLKGANYAIHADMAQKGDKAGLAMSHVVRMETVTEEVTDAAGFVFSKTFSRPIVKTDFVINYAASASTVPPREIQIRWARMLVFELINKGFHIVSVSFDAFASLDSLQILNSHGITSKRVSMDLSEDPWKNWRDLMYEGRYSVPHNATLLSEIEALGRYGGKVDHPPGGSKDAADATCGSVLGAVLYGGAESEDGEIATPGDESSIFISNFDTEFAGMNFETDSLMPIGFANFNPLV